jgi:hypothetical protein
MKTWDEKTVKEILEDFNEALKILQANSLPPNRMYVPWSFVYGRAYTFVKNRKRRRPSFAKGFRRKIK